MILDLNKEVESALECDAQICIIGAGTAGIFLAKLLSERGFQVVILESGGLNSRLQPQEDDEYEQLGKSYRGASHGRSFGLGGTSVLWGGQMIPLMESDMCARPEVGLDAWPIKYAQLLPYYDLIRSSMGLRKLKISHKKRPFSWLSDFSGSFSLRFSEWLPFKKRNFYKAFASIFDEDNVTVWLNATVVSMSRSNNTQEAVINQITAKSPSGRLLQVRPQIVVVCAGALESTRLLLEFDDSTSQSITCFGAPLGRYFSDHLSKPCGRFDILDRKKMNLLIGPTFKDGIMLSPRFELAHELQKKLKLPSAFAHLIAIGNEGSGFDLVRSLLRRMQGEKLKVDINVKKLLNLSIDIMKIIYWRLWYKRLWLPDSAQLLLYIDIEQLPNFDSHLMLTEAIDKNGRKKLGIDWRITQYDADVIGRVAQIFVREWQNSPLSNVAQLSTNAFENTSSINSPYDVYHPTGALRMGTDRSNSVVDKNLCLWGTSNCYVSSTAVFPSAGSANPGMTHLALTAKLADHIVDKISK